MTYTDYQKRVYETLLAQHERDPEFRFSVRQVAAKGNERNYFIGTEKSGYFAFTFWDIPVAFPGAAGDLISFAFWQKDGYRFQFQVSIPRVVTGRQNELDVLFAQRLLAHLQHTDLPVSKPPDKNKIFRYGITPPRPFATFDELMGAFLDLWLNVSKVVDRAIEEVRGEHPDWVAGRFSEARFQELQQKMKDRFAKYANPGSSVSEAGDADEEEEELLILDEESIGQDKRPLNTILYGPPGTGKTFSSITHALSIVEDRPLATYAAERREDIKTRFDARLITEENSAGQIAFITFHQSLAYEDFIEGIKPEPPKEGEEDKPLKYAVKSGMFKSLAESARYRPDAQTTRFSIPEADFRQAMFYKMSLGAAGDDEDDAIYRWCMDHGYVALGWGDDVDFTGKSEAEIKALVKEAGIESFAGEAAKRFIHYVRQGDYILISEGNRTCRAIGRVTGGYEYREDSPIRYHQFRKVQWLLRDVSIPVEAVYSKGFSMQSIYQLDRTGLKQEFFVKAGERAPAVATTPKPFVLIIDEINRGNVSQIFGELITLIEDGKRAGQPEALSATLPYSRESFSVPPNLFIIGTMNTADRSVEALDTALRRRFSFLEMPPEEQHEGIDTAAQIGDAVFNFQTILSTINARLEKLSGRDHKIGHSYFLLRGKDWEAYLAAFTEKIIPLLQEYFYGDWGKMFLVLGDGFVAPKQVGNGAHLFPKIPDGWRVEIADQMADLQDKEVWQLTDWKDQSANDFAEALRKLAPGAIVQPHG